MPYIKELNRKELDGPLAEVMGCIGEIGDLNYSITRLCQNWLGPDPHYHDFNAVIGVLECAKLELYRRAVAPYEDSAILRNGDLY